MTRPNNTPPLIKLTKKQEIVLDYIRRYIQDHRYAPFIHEVQAGCQIPSYKSAIDRLNALERKGYIKRTPSKHRGIRLLKSILLNIPQSEPSVREPVPVEGAI